MIWACCLYRRVKNAVVPSTLACICLVYSVLLVIVMKLDQYDERKADIVRLVDNSPFDRQKYYVSLETGFRKGAGTTAQVNQLCQYFNVYLLVWRCFDTCWRLLWYDFHSPRLKICHICEEVGRTTSSRQLGSLTCLVFFLMCNCVSLLWSTVGPFCCFLCQSLWHGPRLVAMLQVCLMS